MKNTKQKHEIKRKQANTTLILLILFILLTFSSANPASALPQIQLISQTNPIEYKEIQTITLNITTPPNTTITRALIEFDEQNHTLQKQDPGYYTYTWIPSHKGINTYTIYATDSSNETQNYTNSFFVQDTTSPEIIETQPQGILDYNLIELKAITNENSTCKYDEVDVSYDSMTFGLSGEGLIHTKLRSFGNGEHLFYVRCKDPENNIGQSQTISFTIDTQPPAISGITPTSTVNQEQVTLRIHTNEIATCKWSKTNEEYDYLDNQFQTTGATLYEQPLTLLEGINTYYVSCKDQIGNYNNPAITINIELNLPPTASITIEKNDSYKALNQGTYKVSLTTSEPLSKTPLLKLRYSNKIINIPLEGSADNWQGYLIIPNQAGEHIGEFIYTGTDTKGSVGTEITSGKLILIDTTPPPEPKSLRLLNENNKIKLSWEYEGEEPHHFNIYRSITGKTDKSDFKTTTPETTYSDADVINKIGYFYRVSAVDKAGNEGPLSEEEFIMTEYQNTTSQFKQDPELLAIINNNINRLEKIVQNLEIKITELEETTDQDLLQLINEKDLVTQQKNIKDKIQTLIGELKTYRETRLTKEELNTKIEIINTKIKEYQKDILKQVIIKNKVQAEQLVDENLLQKAIQEYLKNKALTQEQRTTYYSMIRNLQEEVRILQEIISYEIEYEYKESQRITLIKETLLSPKELKGVLVQEVIPRDVIKVSEIIFRTPPHELNSIGVLWLIRDLDGAEVKYTVPGEKDLNQLQRIRTILLYDIDEFISQLSAETNTSTTITGKAIAEKKGEFSITKSILIPLGLLLIIVLLIYYSVFLKTETSYEKEIMSKVDQQEREALMKIKIPIKDTNSGVVSEQQSRVSGSEPGLDALFTLIQKAYEALEHKDIRTAHQNYSLALSYYSRMNLSVKNRFKANFELNSLREELIKATKPKDLYT